VNTEVLVVICLASRTRKRMSRRQAKYGGRVFLGNPSPGVYILRGNALALSIALSMKDESPFDTDIYVATELHLWELDDDFRKAVVDNKPDLEGVAWTEEALETTRIRDLIRLPMRR